MTNIELELDDGGYIDLSEIKKSNTAKAAQLYVRIDEARTDQDILLNLNSVHLYEKAGRFNIRAYAKIREMYQIYCFRIRFLSDNVTEYRIFYYYNSDKQQYLIIAIKPSFTDRTGVKQPYDDNVFIEELKDRYDRSSSTTG